MLSRGNLIFCCRMRKMCSCQHLSAQYECLNPQWDLGGWKSPSQVTDDPAKGKTKFKSLSPTLLSASPVSKFWLPVLRHNPSTMRVWLTDFYPCLEGITSLTELTAHKCPVLQINSILSALWQFNLWHQAGSEATEMQKCVPCCWCADGSRSTAGDAETHVDSPGLEHLQLLQPVGLSLVALLFMGHESTKENPASDSLKTAQLSVFVWIWTLEKWIWEHKPKSGFSLP